MPLVLNLPVYFLFAAILYKICAGNESSKFYALALGTMLFPMVGTIISSPTVAPNHAFIYSYLAIELYHSIGKQSTIPKLTIAIPLSFIIISTTATILHTQGVDVKTFYVALRDFFETYGYFIAAYIAGFKIKDYDIFKKAYIPTALLCIFAFIEVLIDYNIPYTIICSAYPNYDMGFTSLENGGTFIEAWRIRATVTTAHPTALGTLLACLFAFYLPLWNKEIIPQKKLTILLALLLIASFVSGSRTSMLCNATALLLFIFTQAKPLVKILCIGAFIFSFGSILAYAIDKFDQSQGSNLQFRKEQLIFSVLSIQQSPIYGNGIQYTSKYIFEDSDNGSKGTAKGSDNENLGGLESIIFRKIIDYGFVGLALFFAFLAYSLFYFVINRKQTQYAHSGALVTLSFSIFLILSGTLANSIVYGLTLMGFCLGKTRLAKDEDDNNSLELEEISKDK